MVKMVWQESTLKTSALICLSCQTLSLSLSVSFRKKVWVKQSTRNFSELLTTNFTTNYPQILTQSRILSKNSDRLQKTVTTSKVNLSGHPDLQVSSQTNCICLSMLLEFCGMRRVSLVSIHKPSRICHLTTWLQKFKSSLTKFRSKIAAAKMSNSTRLVQIYSCWCFIWGPSSVPRSLCCKKDYLFRLLSGCSKKSNQVLNAQSSSQVKWLEASLLRAWVSQPLRWLWILSISQVFQPKMWLLVYPDLRKLSMFRTTLRLQAWRSTLRTSTRRVRVKSRNLACTSSILL